MDEEASVCSFSDNDESSRASGDESEEHASGGDSEEHVEGLDEGKGVVSWKDRLQKRLLKKLTKQLKVARKLRARELIRQIKKAKEDETKLQRAEERYKALQAIKLGELVDYLMDSSTSKSMDDRKRAFIESICAQKPVKEAYQEYQERPVREEQRRNRDRQKKQHRSKPATPRPEKRARQRPPPALPSQTKAMRMALNNEQVSEQPNHQKRPPPPRTSQRGPAKDLHPSWQAKKRQEAQQLQSYSGSIINFDEDIIRGQTTSNIDRKPGPKHYSHDGAVQERHPSWEAKRQLHKQAIQAEFKGSIINFDDDE